MVGIPLAGTLGWDRAGRADPQDGTLNLTPMGANVPDSHPTPGAINLAPTPALSSLRSSGRYGFIKNVSGREVGPTALASHPALADSSRGGAELAA